MSTFCQHSYHKNCQHREVGSQKSQNLVNVVCERTLTKNEKSCAISVCLTLQPSKEKLNPCYLDRIKEI